MTRCVFIAGLFLLPVAPGFLLAFVFFNLIQDEFAHGAFMRHFVEKLELIGIASDPFVNLLVDARIFTMLHRRIGGGRGDCRGRRG